jgi:hypothetical protein
MEKIGKRIEHPFVHKDIYGGTLISNPKIMFVLERLDVPLIDLNVLLPTTEDMNQFNVSEFLEEMKDPIARCIVTETTRNVGSLPMTSIGRGARRQENETNVTKLL